MNPNDPAFPVEYKDFQPGSGNQVVRELVPGLTKREWVATNILTSFARIAMEKNQFHGLNLETSAGVMVLCCNDHRDAGYDFIGKLNTWKASITTPIQN